MTRLSLYQQYKLLLKKKKSAVLPQKISNEPFQFILFDPFRNDSGHYDKLRCSLQNVFTAFHYLTNVYEIQEFDFDPTKSYCIYFYVIKDLRMIEQIYRENMSNIRYFLNIWDDQYIPQLLQFQKSLQHVQIVSDGNICFSKSNKLHSDKPIHTISPGIIDTTVPIQFQKMFPEIGKFVLTWTIRNCPMNHVRWLDRQKLATISNVLKKKNLNLVVIEYDRNKTQTNETIRLIKQNDIFYCKGKIDSADIFYSICKSAEFCLVYSTGNFYKFRSISKISEFLFYDIDFVTNLPVHLLNNIEIENKQNIFFDSLENIPYQPNSSIKSNINDTTWLNENFKKIIVFLNQSNIHQTNLAFLTEKKKEITLSVSDPPKIVAHFFLDSSVDDEIIFSQIRYNKIIVVTNIFLKKYPQYRTSEYVYDSTTLETMSYFLNCQDVTSIHEKIIRFVFTMGFENIHSPFEEIFENVENDLKKFHKSFLKITSI